MKLHCCHNDEKTWKQCAKVKEAQLMERLQNSEHCCWHRKATLQEHMCWEIILKMHLKTKMRKGCQLGCTFSSSVHFACMWHQIRHLDGEGDLLKLNMAVWAPVEVWNWKVMWNQLILWENAIRGVMSVRVEFSIGILYLPLPPEAWT